MSPGAEFDLFLQVTQAGSAFNGVDAVLGFDPAALTLLELTEAEQAGALMTGACANLFHRFQPATNGAKITEVILCNQTFVTGPGQLYRLRFRASTTAQTTQVRWLAGSHFYNSGLYVTPLETSDATIQIGSTSGVDATAFGTGLAVRAMPNPARSRATFRVTAGDGTQELVVADVQGRVVRHLEKGSFGAGTRFVTWDGLSDAGVRAPTGVYLIRLRAGERRTQTRLLLLQ